MLLSVFLYDEEAELFRLLKVSWKKKQMFRRDFLTCISCDRLLAEISTLESVFLSFRN